MNDENRRAFRRLGVCSSTNKFSFWRKAIDHSIFLVFFSPSFFGCAIGPLMSHETARTIGKSRHEVSAGVGTGYVAKWNYGFTENFDIGIHWEAFNLGVRGKYAFINKDQGFSLAFALGKGGSDEGSSLNGDILFSYLVGPWEPYGTLRYGHVKNQPSQRKTEEEIGFFHINRFVKEYNYGQAFLGTRYWFTPHWLLSFELSTTSAFSSFVRVDGVVLGSLAFGYRF